VFSQLFVELGYYIVVDRSCRFAVSETTSMAVAVEGMLTQQQADELSDFLALSEWEGLASVHGFSLCDGAGTRFAFGDRIIDLIPFCGAVPIPEVPTDFVHVLGTLPRELASRLRPLGEPASGPVRYELGRDGETSFPDPVYEGAPEWPLDTPAALLSILVPSEDMFLSSGTLRVWTATGPDAVRLRALRAGWLKGEIRGLEEVQFIPIAGRDGHRYRLVLRDVVEFESGDGEAFVSWIDLGQPVAPIP